MLYFSTKPAASELNKELILINILPYFPGRNAFSVTPVACGPSSDLWKESKNDAII